jgi:site-specific DNA-methyltransferase (adenine-specific)
MNIDLRLGDCIEVMRTLPDNSVDSVVCDPPYHLTSSKGDSKGFMGKEWDGGDIAFRTEVWAECLRVLKPGGYLLSFSSPRTYHRMAVAIEDAGFEIRDQIMWLFGSGFPKSHNIGKAIDKRGGESIGWFGEWLKKWRNDNEIPQSQIAELFPSKTGGLTGCVSNWELGNNLPTNEQFNLICETFDLPFKSLEEAEREFIGTKGNSDWEGWGTALKPAHEPICMARKPLSEKSIAENVLKWGTGGINIDGCRIGVSETEKVKTEGHIRKGNVIGDERTSVAAGQFGDGAFVAGTDLTNGRFPANLIIECICDNSYTKPAPKSGHWSKTTTTGFGEFGNGSSTYEGVGEKESGNMVIHTNPECPCYMLDQQSGVKKSQKRSSKHNKDTEHTNTYTPKASDYREDNTYADKGGASRFFYSPKVSKKERNAGLEELPEKPRPGQTDKGNYSSSVYCKDCGKTFNGTNDHTDCEDGVEYRPSTTTTKNHHPTVKPLALMKYLIKMITPPNGVVLEPFLGSGSTGVAAKELGFVSTFIGIEKEQEYMDIAIKRIGK